MTSKERVLTSINHKTSDKVNMIFICGTDFGTPQEVEEQVLRHCEIFSKNGGFVFNTVHNIQANVPVENLVAMLKAVRRFNGEGM